jgi:acyl-CoA thioesterase FadM
MGSLRHHRRMEPTATVPLPPLPPLRLRVRYAECDADGELFPAAIVHFSVEGLAAALTAAGLDLHELASPRGPLRAAGVHLTVDAAAPYDSELDVLCLGATVDASAAQFRLRVQHRRGAARVAEATLHYAARAGRSLPPDVAERLTALGRPARAAA